MRFGGKVSWLAFPLLACSTITLAEVNKQAYELSERCGKQVAAEFKREFGSGIVGGRIYSYQSHYNSKLNKCLYLLTYRTDVSVYRTLYDFHENRELAAFHSSSGLTDCRVGDIECRSEAQWSSMVKRLMEE